MNYFRAKPEYIICNYIIARDTAQLAMKYPLLSVFQLRMYIIIIHQIFLLTRDWPKRVTCPNIPQLKLGNIRD